MALSLMPAGVASADIEDVCGNVPESHFTDRGTTHADNIDCLFAYGITAGQTETTFGTTNPTTRGQAAALFTNFAVVATDGAIAAEVGDEDVPFTDIDGSFFESEIETIFRLGLVVGTTPTTYSPNDHMTRAQFATILFNAHVALGVDFGDLEEYPQAFDDTVGSVHNDAINALAGEGIIRGTTPTTFSPQDRVLRGQVASLLMRSAGLLDELGLWDAPPLDEPTPPDEPEAEPDPQVGVSGPAQAPQNLDVSPFDVSVVNDGDAATDEQVEMRATVTRDGGIADGDATLDLGVEGWEPIDLDKDGDTLTGLVVGPFDMPAGFDTNYVLQANFTEVDDYQIEISLVGADTDDIYATDTHDIEVRPEGDLSVLNNRTDEWYEELDVAVDDSESGDWLSVFTDVSHDERITIDHPLTISAPANGDRPQVIGAGFHIDGSGDVGVTQDGSDLGDVRFGGLDFRPDEDLIDEFGENEGATASYLYVEGPGLSVDLSSFETTYDGDAAAVLVRGEDADVVVEDGDVDWATDTAGPALWADGGTMSVTGSTFAEGVTNVVFAGDSETPTDVTLGGNTFDSYSGTGDLALYAFDGDGPVTLNGVDLDDASVDDAYDAFNEANDGGSADLNARFDLDDTYFRPAINGSAFVEFDATGDWETVDGLELATGQTETWRFGADFTSNSRQADPSLGADATDPDGATYGSLSALCDALFEESCDDLGAETWTTQPTLIWEEDDLTIADDAEQGDWEITLTLFDDATGEVRDQATFTFEVYEPTWASQGAGTSFHLNGVGFFDDQIGWLVGNNQTIRHTDDGGDTWGTQSVTTSDLRGLHVHDDQTAWAVGDDGDTGFRSVRTTDGGDAWQNQAEFEVDQRVRDVDFIDENVGWVVGDQGMIQYTDNAGSAAGGDGWVEQDVDLTGTLWGVSAVDADNVWAVGVEDGTDTAVAHYDGDEWEVVHQTDDHDGTPRAVHFVDADTGWVVGSSGMILHTTDGGDTWSEQESDVSTTLTAVHMLDEDTGWIVGEIDTVLRTTDGGDDWEEVDTGGANSNSLRDVVFLDPYTGWAVGDLGTVIHFGNNN